MRDSEEMVEGRRKRLIRNKERWQNENREEKRRAG